MFRLPSLVFFIETKTNYLKLCLNRLANCLQCLYEYNLKFIYVKKYAKQTSSLGG